MPSRDSLCTGAAAVVATLLSGQALAQCPALAPLPGGMHFGWGVVDCGDYNEDGYNDFLVSSLAYESPCLISGRTGQVMERFDPDDGDYGKGSAVSRAFFDADGWHEVAVVGDRYGQVETTGGPMGVVRLHSLYTGDQKVLMSVDQRSAWFGHAVASTMYSDGPHQILVGSPGYGLVHLDFPEADNRGAVFVYSEGDIYPLQYLLRHVIIGEQRQEYLGEAVAMLDPLHEGLPGEPFPEGAFAAGAPRADGVEPDVGRVDVVDMLTGEIAYSLYGEMAFDWFGSSVAAAGDVDGDGYNDLIVGAPNHSRLADHAGRAYVFSGANGAPLWVFDGEAASDLFGTAVAAAGDADGDGFADLLVGAPLHSSRLRNAGRVYLYSGADGSLLKTLDGPAEDGQFGQALASAWQFQATGRFFVGAPMAETHLYEGLAYALSDRPLLEGDIDQDGWVDQSDLGVLLTSYELSPDDPGYEPLADINGDGAVDQSDLGLLLVNYDKQCSAD